MALRGGDEEDEAPWLAAAEPDGRETYVSHRRFKLVAILLGALLLVVVALIYAVIARPHDGGEEIGWCDADGHVMSRTDIRRLSSRGVPHRAREIEQRIITRILQVDAHGGKVPRSCPVGQGNRVGRSKAGLRPSTPPRADGPWNPGLGGWTGGGDRDGCNHRVAPSCPPTQ